jgi:hypothetical protein
MHFKERGGFTLMELVIFAGIFTLTVASFLTVLVAMTRVQVRQSGAAEVNQQSQFLLQTIQRYVEQSSMIDLARDSATTTLRLRMASSSYDPTLLFASGTALWIQEGSSTPQVLTSPKVTITNLSFVKHENPGGHDSVSVVFTANYNAPNAASNFVQSLTTSVARVSAATFDSNIIPSTGNTFKLGASAGDWQSVNNTIIFSGSNVGIGVTPTAKFQVNSGDVYIDTTSRGVIQKSADGTCWRLAVSNAGALSAASTTCP